MTARLRITHVTMQVHGQMDDGETLTPIASPALQLTAKEFEEYVSSGRYAEETATWEAEGLAALKPNRATRRKKPTRKKPTRARTRKSTG